MTNERPLTPEQISAFLDGDLPADEMKKVREKLATCGASAARLADYEAMRQAIGSETIPAPPEGLAEKIQSQIAGESAKTAASASPPVSPEIDPPVRRSWSRRAMPLAAAATVVIGLLAVVLLRNPSQFQPESVTAQREMTMDSEESGAASKEELRKALESLGYVDASSSDEGSDEPLDPEALSKLQSPGDAARGESPEEAQDAKGARAQQDSAFRQRPSEDQARNAPADEQSGKASGDALRGVSDPSPRVPAEADRSEPPVPAAGRARSDADLAAPKAVIAEQSAVSLEELPETEAELRDTADAVVSSAPTPSRQAVATNDDLAREKKSADAPSGLATSKLRAKQEAAKTTETETMGFSDSTAQRMQGTARSFAGAALVCATKTEYWKSDPLSWNTSSRDQAIREIQAFAANLGGSSITDSSPFSITVPTKRWSELLIQLSTNRATTPPTGSNALPSKAPETECTVLWFEPPK